MSEAASAADVGVLNRQQFDQRGIAYDATLRNIELLGESARHIPEEERQKVTGIDWRGAIAVRKFGIFSCTDISALTTR